MEEEESFEASLEKIICNHHPEMKELERKIYAITLANNINEMIEKAYSNKEEDNEI